MNLEAHMAWIKVEQHAPPLAVMPALPSNGIAVDKVAADGLKRPGSS